MKPNRFLSREENWNMDPFISLKAREKSVHVQQ